MSWEWRSNSWHGWENRWSCSNNWSRWQSDWYDNQGDWPSWDSTNPDSGTLAENQSARSAEELGRKSVRELQQLCGEHRLKKTGKKADLVQRLLATNDGALPALPAPVTASARSAALALPVPNTPRKRTRSPASATPPKKLRAAAKSLTSAALALPAAPKAKSSPGKHTRCAAASSDTLVVKACAACESDASSWRRELGVPGDATFQQIKAAWRRLALQHHPDKGGDLQRFQKLQDAFQSLVSVISEAATQNERNEAAEAQLAARCFLYDIIEGAKSWEHVLRGLETAVLEYLKGMLTYETTAKLDRWTKAGATGIISQKTGYRVKVGWHGWYVLTSAVTSLEEALSWHEALVCLRARCMRRVEAESSTKPMKVSELWQMLQDGKYTLPPALLQFKSDKVQGRLRKWTQQSMSVKTVKMHKESMDKAGEAEELEKVREKLKRKSEKEKTEHRNRLSKVRQATCKELERRNSPGTAAIEPEQPKLALPPGPEFSGAKRDECRAKAEGIASYLLKQDGAPTDEDVLQVLQAWCFDQNRLRAHLSKDKSKWCSSDTFGLTVMNGLHVVGSTEPYRSFQTLLAQWIRAKCPEAVFTTIVINHNFEIDRHRDSKNVGPTILLAGGDFTGGGLRLWLGDGDKVKLHDLSVDDSTVVPLDELKYTACLFDGNKAHEVLPFEGDRFSIMAYTVRGFLDATDSDRHGLEAMSYNFPTHETLCRLRRTMKTAEQPQTRPHDAV